MENKRSIKTTNILRNTVRYFLLVLGILVFVFALFSGSENYGGGVSGIIKNSPNAVPWLILLMLIFIAWKQELVGGIIICMLGIAGMYFLTYKARISFYLHLYLLF